MEGGGGSARSAAPGQAQQAPSTRLQGSAKFFGVLLKLRGCHKFVQARIEAVGQVLMWKAVEAAPGLQRLGRRSRRPARAAYDRYEEHMLLPDDRVALMTNQRLMLVSAPGFAKVWSAAGFQCNAQGSKCSLSCMLCSAPRLGRCLLDYAHSH